MSVERKRDLARGTEIRLFNYEGGLSELEGDSLKLFREGMDRLEERDYASAAKSFESCGAVGAADGEAVALNVLMGNACAGLGDFEKAITFYEAASQGAEKRKDTLARTAVLFNIGMIQKVLKKNDLAGAAFVEGLNLAEGAGDSRTMTACLEALSEIALESGDHEEALRCARVAYDVHREASNAPETARALSLMAFACREKGDFREAAALYSQAMSIYEEIENIGGEINCLAGLAALCIDLTEYAEAVNCCDRALDLIANENDPAERAEMLFAKAVALRRDYKAAEAVNCFIEAEGIFGELRDDFSLGNCSYELVAAYLDLNDNEKAFESFMKASDSYEIGGEFLMKADALTGAADALSRIGARQKAMELFEKTLELLEALQEEGKYADVSQHLAALLFQSGRRDDALKLMQKALDIYQRGNDEEGCTLARNNIEIIMRE